jgi:CHAT domain-containing protein
MIQQANGGGAQSSGRVSPQTELEDVRFEYNAFQTAMYAAHPGMKMRRGEMDPIHADEVQRLAGPATAFLEFALTKDKLFAFVFSGRPESSKAPGPRVFVQPVSEKKLESLVHGFREQLANRDLGFRAVAAQLYRIVLGDATSSLKGITRLVVIPDGVLWELPFQALVDPSGRYVLDRYSISYAPSLTALKYMMATKTQLRQTVGPIQLLAMGNPTWSTGDVERVKAVYRDQNLGNLPLAETEVRQLTKLYGEGRSHVYIGREALESRFKAEAAQSGVLHLATHGILNNASPLYSYLLLAHDDNSSADDGLLEAWELLEMKLHAELAVLSACETARGRVGPGEGMIGFSWALFVAGVPVTVLSQWKVASDSTSQLMLSFHQNRLKNLSDAEALRLAAIKVRRNAAFQHPFYWAPFIVIGAGTD